MRPGWAASYGGMDLRTTIEAIRGLATNVERVITGKRRAVELVTAGLFAGQHVLIEDVPGVGKTMLARSIARSIDGTFKRVQGTSDLLPSDITGSTVYDQSHGGFSFVPGPVFANVVLVDEINRATPKSQSALLEVMDEGGVSADGARYEVSRPFFVVATRNPLEHHGTFPLPEGELDRFGLSVAMGYPDFASERQVVLRQMAHHPLESLEPVVSPDDIVAHQDGVRSVHIEDSVLDYLLAIVRATREHPEISLGASPRGSLALTRLAQASALLHGRDYVLPDDVKTTAPSVLAHRVMLTPDRPQGTDHARTVIDGIIHHLPAPVALERS